MPVALVTNFDLAAVLSGRTMTVTTTDGSEVQVRLYTPDELEAAMAESQSKFLVDPPPGGNRPHAERLTRIGTVTL